MKYDITTNKAPGMPNLGKGTECIKLLLSQASKDMHEPLVPMLFPSLGAHISDAEFQYPDRSWKEMCGLMAQLVGDSGDNKLNIERLTLNPQRSLQAKRASSRLQGLQRLLSANEIITTLLRPNLRFIPTPPRVYLEDSPPESGGARGGLNPLPFCLFRPPLTPPRSTTGRLPQQELRRGIRGGEFLP